MTTTWRWRAEYATASVADLVVEPLLEVVAGPGPASGMLARRAALCVPPSPHLSDEASLTAPFAVWTRSCESLARAPPVGGRPAPVASACAPVSVTLPAPLRQYGQSEPGRLAPLQVSSVFGGERDVAVSWIALGGAGGEWWSPLPLDVGSLVSDDDCPDLAGSAGFEGGDELSPPPEVVTDGMLGGECGRRRVLQRSSSWLAVPDSAGQSEAEASTLPVPALRSIEVVVQRLCGPSPTHDWLPAVAWADDPQAGAGTATASAGPASLGGGGVSAWFSSWLGTAAAGEPGSRALPDAGTDAAGASRLQAFRDRASARLSAADGHGSGLRARSVFVRRRRVLLVCDGDSPAAPLSLSISGEPRRPWRLAAGDTQPCDALVVGVPVTKVGAPVPIGALLEGQVVWTDPMSLFLLAEAIIARAEEAEPAGRSAAAAGEQVLPVCQGASLTRAVEAPTLLPESTGSASTSSGFASTRELRLAMMAARRVPPPAGQPVHVHSRPAGSWPDTSVVERLRVLCSDTAVPVAVEASSDPSRGADQVPSGAPPAGSDNHGPARSWGVLHSPPGSALVAFIGPNALATSLARDEQAAPLKLRLEVDKVKVLIGSSGRPVACATVRSLGLEAAAAPPRWRQCGAALPPMRPFTADLAASVMHRPGVAANGTPGALELQASLGRATLRMLRDAHLSLCPQQAHNRASLLIRAVLTDRRAGVRRAGHNGTSAGEAEWSLRLLHLMPLVLAASADSSRVRQGVEEVLIPLAERVDSALGSAAAAANAQPVASWTSPAESAVVEFERLSLDPATIEVSLTHADPRFRVAARRAQLRLSACRVEGVMAAAPDLGRLLAAHFIADAVLSLPRLLGSLDILGSLPAWAGAAEPSEGLPGSRPTTGSASSNALASAWRRATAAEASELATASSPELRGSASAAATAASADSATAGRRAEARHEAMIAASALVSAAGRIGQPGVGTASTRPSLLRSLVSGSSGLARHGVHAALLGLASVLSSASSNIARLSMDEAFVRQADARAAEGQSGLPSSDSDRDETASVSTGPTSATHDWESLERPERRHARSVSTSSRGPGQLAVVALPPDAWWSLNGDAVVIRAAACDTVCSDGLGHRVADAPGSDPPLVQRAAALASAAAQVADERQPDLQEPLGGLEAPAAEARAGSGAPVDTSGESSPRSESSDRVAEGGDAEAARVPARSRQTIGSAVWDVGSSIWAGLSGIVVEPIRAVSVSPTLASAAAGVGRGLAGAVTKPLSAVASLTAGAARSAAAGLAPRPVAGAPQRQHAGAREAGSPSALGPRAHGTGRAGPISQGGATPRALGPATSGRGRLGAAEHAAGQALLRAQAIPQAAWSDGGLGSARPLAVLPAIVTIADSFQDPARGLRWDAVLVVLGQPSGPRLEQQAVGLALLVRGRGSEQSAGVGDSSCRRTWQAAMQQCTEELAAVATLCKAEEWESWVGSSTDSVLASDGGSAAAAGAGAASAAGAQAAETAGRDMGLHSPGSKRRHGQRPPAVSEGSQLDLLTSRSEHQAPSSLAVTSSLCSELAVMSSSSCREDVIGMDAGGWLCAQLAPTRQTELASISCSRSGRIRMRWRVPHPSGDGSQFLGVDARQIIHQPRGTAR